MTKSLLAILIAISLVLSGCGQSLTTSTKTYPTYGFFNKSTDKSKDVCYKISVGNEAWTIILVETIIGPIYFIGFPLFPPTRIN